MAPRRGSISEPKAGNERETPRTANECRSRAVMRRVGDHVEGAGSGAPQTEAAARRVRGALSDLAARWPQCGDEALAVRQRCRDARQLRVCPEPLDLPRQRRLPSALNGELLADGRELPSAQRVGPDGFIPLDDRCQLLACPFQDADDRLGFTKTLAQFHQRTSCGFHQTTPRYVQLQHVEPAENLTSAFCLSGSAAGKNVPNESFQ